MAIFTGFVALIVTVVFGMLKSSDVYKDALARAKADPAVEMALGSPIDAGLLVMGNIKISGASGKADLAIPISGPDDEATLYVVAEKSAGRWTFLTLVVDIASTGQRIDLLKNRTKRL